MADKLQELKNEIRAFHPSEIKELEDFRISFLGKKGKVTALFKAFKDIPAEERKEYGQKVNEIKDLAQQKVDENRERLENEALKKGIGKIDLTLDPVPLPLGSLHPLEITRNQLVYVFQRIGFHVSDGPHIVDDWHNFTALNFPEDHPARDMQDTFFVQEDEKYLLRTHTSPVQISTMLKKKPPIKTIAPGMVFRKDNDATHSPYFNQVEGLYVDEGVSFADLKKTLLYFVNEIFGSGTEIRFRASYFPFTEPSAELDIKWNKAGKDNWMEILGCGMVDPNVLENCGLDSNIYTGFAFGLGIERIAMLKYGISDIRLFYENDIRFLRQFTSAK